MPVATPSDWHEYLRGKWLLWDTCALIRVIKFNVQQELFELLEGLSVENAYIPPIQLELLATTDNKDRLLRSDILVSRMSLLPFGQAEIHKAEQIQLAP